MKNRLLFAPLVLIVIANLTACSSTPNEGNSEEDTSDTAAPCDHQWIDATCTEPKTCSICGITEGDPLGHDFTPATVDSPKKCKVCGIEECENVKVKTVNLSGEGWWDYDYTNDAVLNCKFTDEINGRCLHYYCYDFDLNPLYDGFLEFTDSIGYPYYYFYDLSHGLFYWLTLDEKTSYLEVYKVSESGFEQIYGSEVPGSYKKADFKDALQESVIADSEKYHMMSVMGYTFAYDIENNCLCPEEEVKDKEVIEYDESLWSICVKAPQIDGYLVGNKDGSSWGYLDKDGNEIAMYADATGFNANGYTLVSEDGRTYSIIDKDFNIIGNGLFEGVGAYLVQDKSSCFFVIHADGTSTLVKIE